MSITVTCDDCSEIHRVRDDAAGKRLKCRGCGKSLRVEAPASPEDDFSDLVDSEQDDDDPDAAGASTSRSSGSRIATKSQMQETKLPTIAVAEVVGCSVAGVVGAVLIGISLLGGFGHANEAVFIAVVIGLVPLFMIVMSNRNVRRQTYALRRVANQMHLEFADAGNEQLHQSLECFHLASLGHSSAMTNLMFGKRDGTDIAVFDYQYFRGKYYFRQTVVRLQRRRLRLPSFFIQPFSWSTRDLFAMARGDDHIRFESHPVFSKKYLLRGDDERAIRELFTGDVLRFYEQHPGLITEGAGNKLLFYRDEVVVKPENIRSFLDEALAVRSLFQPTTE